MKQRNTQIHPFSSVCIFMTFLAIVVLVDGHNDTDIIKYRSYKGTILSNCTHVTPDITSVIECGRLFSDSNYYSAFVYNQSNTCIFCETLEDVEFNATEKFFTREPNILYPRQDKLIWIPGGLRVGQLIEVQTKVHYDRHSDCGVCFVFYNGTADTIGRIIPLALQVHFYFTHIHAYTIVNGSVKVHIKNVTRQLLEFDQDFTTRFLVTAKGFKISVEGQFYMTYNHVFTELDNIQYFCLNCITYNRCDYGILSDMELRLPDL